MSKVKVDVQLLVTGGVGDGKTAITHRILKAIQADQGLQSICKLHPAQSYEILRGELTRLTFTGELKHSAGMKEPSAMYSEVPGYPNADEMLSYLTSVINETELSKAMKQHEQSTVISHTDKAGNRTEYKPFKVVIDTVTGQMCEWRAGEKLSTRDRVITILADASTEPVGMHQDDAQTAVSQASAATLAGFGVDMNSAGREGLGYATRCASLTIPPKAIDEHTLECNAHAVKVKDGECICDYAKRFDESFEQPTQALKDLMAGKPVEGSEAIEGFGLQPTKSAAPKPDAHINKADRTLLMFTVSIADQFQPVVYEEAVYPNGLVAGNKVQIIFDNGDLISGAVSEFSWRKGSSIADIVYYRRLD